MQTAWKFSHLSTTMTIIYELPLWTAVLLAEVRGHSEDRNLWKAFSVAYRQDRNYLAALVTSADLTRTVDVSYPQCTVLTHPGAAVSELTHDWEADAYSAELWDYYTIKKDNREIVERMIISSMGIERAMAEVSMSLNTKIGRLSKRRQLHMLTVEF